MTRPYIIGVMGGGSASDKDIQIAYTLGKLVAEEGWNLLCGGRNCGIMDSVAKGAFEAGGLTIGILPGSTYENLSEYIKVPVLTGMGNARNIINVLTSSVIVACSGGAGTLSEIALAIKSGKQVITMNYDTGSSFDKYKKEGLVHYVDEPEEAVEIIKKVLGGR